MARNQDQQLLVAPQEINEVEFANVAPDAHIKGSEVIDPFLVCFSLPIDSGNPLDWPTGKKWMVTDVLSATGFNRIMVSTIMAPALPTIATELSMNSTEAAMSMSIYLLATAFGPLIIGPLSEVYGRRITLHVSNIWFLVFNILCGFANTKGTLIAARFFAGFGASAIYALSGGVLGDIWRPEQRGQSLGVYLLIPLLAAAVGPIIGGFIAGHSTWRWMFWSTSIFQAGMILVSFFSFPETYGPLILRRRAENLRKRTGNNRYHTTLERSTESKSALRKIGRAISRPGLTGILYVVLSTFSELFTKQYGQSVEISGLHYIACSLGEIAASQLSGRLLDYFYKRQTDNSTRVPEDRLSLSFPGLAIGWAGALIYGWVAQIMAPWIVVDIGVFIMLFGLQLYGMPISAYLIDAYPEHTSSALAATQFGRSLLAFLFPLFAPSMYVNLGYGWGNSLMALIGVVFMLPLTGVIWRMGLKLRQNSGTTY